MKNEILDPICGMKVDPEKSKYHFDHEGKQYSFCSKHCLEKFKSNPTRYLQKEAKNPTQQIATEYTCPMHPEVIQDHPGSCPICGMALEPKTIQVGSDDNHELKDMRLRFWIGALFSLPLLIIAMGSMIPMINQYIPTQISRWLQLILSTPVVLWAGWPFLKKGWQSLQNRHLNMFTLISLGVGIAYLFSLIAFFFPHLFPSTFLHQGETPLYFETAAIITVLVLLGQVLELNARSQTSNAIKTLLGRAAKTARIVREDQLIEVSIEEVKSGDILKVLPGDKIPVDGVIIEGESYVDESMVTGESMPVKKEATNPVIGGTINQKGSFLMKVEKVGKETLLSQIIQMVTNAQRSRAPIQSLADTVSGYFVPIVILIAILTFLLWTWLGPEPSFVYGLVNAVAVLIIACPCALGLATPMSIMVGMGRGAEAGILIKNAEALEKLEKVKTIFVDKTGTLTEGKPQITDIFLLDPKNETEMLRLVASVEQSSEHPLADPIIKKAQALSLNLPKTENFQSYTGLGISGKVQDHQVIAGTLKLLEEKKVSIDPLILQKAKEFQNNAQTTIFIAIDDHATGLIAISDPIKASTQKAVKALHEKGLRIIMLSGDNEQTANAVAQKLAINEVHANTSPESKQQFIDLEKHKNGLVAMAGDGINDAPSLAAADVGIAMSTGTDVAMESAAVTLVKGDLNGIAKAIHLSRAMMRNIRQNLFFAFIYNLLGIPIAAGLFYPFTGLLLNPAIAALAMSLSSVSVILNSLRLRRLKL